MQSPGVPSVYAMEHCKSKMIHRVQAFPTSGWGRVAIVIMLMPMETWSGFPAPSLDPLMCPVLRSGMVPWDVIVANDLLRVPVD